MSSQAAPPTLVQLRCNIEWSIQLKGDVYIGQEWKHGPFDYEESKWFNGDMTLGEYEQHVRETLMIDLDELSGKSLGCWCPPWQPDCHGQVLTKLWRECHPSVNVAAIEPHPYNDDVDIVNRLICLPIEPKPAKSRRLYRDQSTHPMGLASIEWPIGPGPNDPPIIYVDESSTSNLAGPMHVAAVLLLPNFDVKGIHDSKLLTEHERYYKFHELVVDPNLVWHIESVSNTTIDQHGKQHAWRDAVRECCLQVQRKALEKGVNPTTILLDGDQNVAGCCLPLILEPKADYKYVGVAAASILAKASRDVYMQRMACNYPAFYENFHSSGGSHSTSHASLIHKGIYTDLHRRSFNPLKTYLAKPLHITHVTTD